MIVKRVPPAPTERGHPVRLSARSANHLKEWINRRVSGLRPLADKDVRAPSW